MGKHIGLQRREPLRLVLLILERRRGRLVHGLSGFLERWHDDIHPTAIGQWVFAIPRLASDVRCLVAGLFERDQPH
jgi:hypothetical protein